MKTLSLSRRRLIVTGAAAMALHPARRQAFAAANTIALDRTFNPYGLSDDTKVMLRAGAPGDGAQSLAALKQAIAAREGLQPDNVMICAGPDALLAAAATACGKKLVCAQPTMSGMTEAAARAGVAVVQVPLARDMRLDFAAMQAQAADAGVYICNPHDPTGVLADGRALRAFIAALPATSLTIVDEAYVDLTDDPARTSVVDQVKAGSNLVICRDFSHVSGLQDHPVAYALARADIIARLTQSALPPPDALSAKAALTSYQDTDFASYSRQMTRACVGYTRALFSQLGVKQLPTQAGFVMFDTGRAPGAFRDFMHGRDIIVADVAAPYASWCRIGVGLMQDMERFADATRAFYKP